MVETGNLNGYTPSGGTADDNYDLTNSYTPGKVSVSGTKTWDDAGNQDGKRPASITVQLQKKVGDGDWGNVEGKTATITNEQLSYTFSDLPEYEGGKLVEYRVVETGDLNGYTQSGGTAGDNYNLTNSYTPETVKVEGEKTWNDNDDQDGKRPDEITVQLQKKVGESGNWTDVDGKTATINDNNLTYSFTDLPKCEDGQVIEYRVKETGNLNGYTPSGGTADDNYDLTNSYTPGKVSVSGTKTWDDAGNQDGKRPASITVQLQKKVGDGDWGNVEGKTATITNEQLSYTFSDLPEYEGGKLVEYRVVETGNLNGYTPSGGTADDNYNLTNSYTPETVDIAGKKTWDDNDDADGNRPDEITVRLLADGEEINRAVVTEADNWSWSFGNLPKYKNGRQIVYAVAEDAVTNYTPEVNGYDVTNHYTPGKTSVSVTKVWKDNDDQDGFRPESVTVKLFANGEDTGRTVILNEGNKWTAAFDDLNRDADGKPVEYTVKEVLEGAAADKYTSVISGDAGTGFMITNSHAPETVDIEGTKTWDDSDNQDGKRPDEITIRLHADGKPADTVTVSAEDNWTWTFTDLPKYAEGREIVYTITEDAVSGYEPDYEGYNITNTHTPDKTTVTVIKAWQDGDNQDGIRPEKVTVKLLANGKDTGKSLTLSEENRWTDVFTDLDEYAAGEKIVYTVEETAVDGYDTVITGNAETGFTITNSHTPAVTAFSGSKTWDDNNDQDGRRPDSITIRLYANGEQTEVRTVTAEDDWAWTFENLPKYENGKEIIYTITEDPVSDYQSEIYGMNVTNSYTPGQINIPVTKNWKDQDDADGIRPDSITVKLYANGKETGKVLILNQMNRWTDSFNNLDEYADGEKIIYSIAEVRVEGYEVSISGNSETGFVISNSHTPEIPDVP